MLPAVRGWCLAVTLAGCVPGERQVNAYESVEAARADGLFLRGWLPDVLPPHSGPIVEAHDLDTNAGCSRSSFPPHLTAELRISLLKAGFRDGGTPPQSLPLSICPFEALDIEEPDYVFIRTPNPSGPEEFAAVASGILYLWSSPR